MVKMKGHVKVVSRLGGLQLRIVVLLCQAAVKNLFLLNEMCHL